MRFVPILLLTVGLTGQATVARDADPVVLTGSDLSPLSFIGQSVDAIVAFRYADTWQQIPLQIDERKYVDFKTIYHDLLPVPAGLGITAYADPTTYTGPDDDPTFDANDELVFMARDVGDRAPSNALLPTGVQSGPGIEIAITDPIVEGATYVYLFRSAGELTPDAGVDDVTYTFDLTAGSYIPDYNLADGPNPEDSIVVTPYYRTHFADRWIRDELVITTKQPNDVDILDRHRNLFAPGNCHRSEDTFSDAEGAFVTNKDGPVRAIRSYMGANSGPLTQREHLFYEQRHDVTTFLRVHAIPGILDLYDYNANAVGMSYANSLNPIGTSIDGVPDVLVAGMPDWEMVSGWPGTVVVIHTIDTDIDPLVGTLYHSDNSTPAVSPCTGDAYEVAASGPWLDRSIPNTDPSLGEYNHLAARRTVFYEPPHQTAATAQQRWMETLTPLDPTITTYPPIPGDLDGDMDVDADDFGLFQVCISGANITPPEPDCLEADFDRDNDVDQSDFGLLQRCLSGPGLPADPDCGG